MSISIIPVTGYAIPDTSGGGGGGVPLVAGANPAAQYASPGTTSLTFAFPAIVSGTAPYTYNAPVLTAPSGSTATISGTAPGNITINNAADGESYLIRVYISDASTQEVLNDAIGAVLDVTFVPIPQVVPPARQALASSATSASVTFTQPGAIPGTTYSITISNVTDGLSVVPTSGSGLGPYAFPVATGKDYIAVLTATAPDGQVASNVAQVAVSGFPAFTGTNPSPQQLSSASTSTTITFSAPTGGDGTYTIKTLELLYDSSENYTATSTGSGLGPYTVSGLASGASYIFGLMFEDGQGQLFEAQAAISVNATVSPITFTTTPANQTLPATATSAVIGTWGAPSGGTGPYTYAFAALGPVSVLTSGSDLGPYTAINLSAGNTYIFQITATDSLGAKGYSIVTIVTEAATANWIVVQETDFTDSNWTAVDSTDVTQSTTVPQFTLYAADGVTARAQVWNNTAQVRRLMLSPSGQGLILATTNTGASPSIKVIPLGALGINVFQTLNYPTDMIKVEFLGFTDENAGTAAFTRLIGMATAFTNTGIQHGFRIINSGSGVQPQRRSWTSSAVDVSQSVITTGATRKVWFQWEGYLTGSRTVESYAQYSATTALGFPTVARSGRYYFHQAVSQVQTTTPVLVDFGSTNAANQFGFIMYNDGSVIDTGVDLSRIVLTKIRISRLINGSKPVDYAPSRTTSFTPISAIVPPARQALAAGTTSASVTFTHPSAPAGMVYSVTINQISSGAVLTPTGAGLGPYTFAVTYGQDYVITLVGTSTDGQVVSATTYVAVASYALMAAGVNPASLYTSSGTASLSFAFPSVSGGVPAVSYVQALTKPAGSNATLSGTAPGTLTISGSATDGQGYLIRVAATDAVGQIVQNSAVGYIDQAASFVDLTAATPAADQSLVAGTTTTSLTWTHPGAPGNVAYQPILHDFVEQTDSYAVSGSGLGPYVFNVKSGYGYGVYMTEIGPDGQSEFSQVTSVQVGLTTGWVSTGSIDFTTDITAGSSTATSGNVTILKGDGVTTKAVGTILQTGTGTSRSVSWGTANGIVISITDNNDATTYTYQFLLNLTSIATATDWSKPVLIEAICGNLVIPPDLDGTGCGTAIGPTAALGNGYSQMLWNDNTSQYITFISYSAAATNVTATGIQPVTPGDGIIQLLVQGSTVTCFIKNSVSTLQNGLVTSPTFTARATYANTAFADNTTAVYSAGLFYGPFTQCRGLLTSGLALKQVQILQYNFAV